MTIQEHRAFIIQSTIEDRAIIREHFSNHE